MSIKQQMASLRAQMAEIDKQIADVRKTCPHADIESQPGANTGGFDGPAFDSYWVDVNCLDCGGRWTYYSDDDNEKYRYYCSSRFLKKEK